MQSEERLTLTVAETARMLGIGRNQAYEAVRRGEIPAVRIGRRIVIPRAAIDRLLGLPSDAKVGTKTRDQRSPGELAGASSCWTRGQGQLQ